MAGCCSSAEEPSRPVTPQVDNEGSNGTHERMTDANRRASVADKNYAKLRSVCVGARQVWHTFLCLGCLAAPYCVHWTACSLQCMLCMLQGAATALQDIIGPLMQAGHRRFLFRRMLCCCTEDMCLKQYALPATPQTDACCLPKRFNSGQTNLARLGAWRSHTSRD